LLLGTGLASLQGLGRTHMNAVHCDPAMVKPPVAGEITSAT